MARGGGGGVERWGDADWEKEGFAFSAQQWIIGLQGGHQPGIVRLRAVPWPPPPRACADFVGEYN